MTKDTFTDNGTKHSQTNRLVHTIEEGVSPSEAVIKATAKLTGTSVLDLEPLYHVIDPAHIDGVLEKANGGASNTEISFEFNGCDVKVESTRVVVRRGDST